MAGLAVFDTNILIDLFSGHEKASQTLARFPEKQAISLITWIEVMVGGTVSIGKRSERVKFWMRLRFCRYHSLWQNEA